MPPSESIGSGIKPNGSSGTTTMSIVRKRGGGEDTGERGGGNIVIQENWPRGGRAYQCTMGCRILTCRNSTSLQPNRWKNCLKQCFKHCDSERITYHLSEFPIRHTWWFRYPVRIETLTTEQLTVAGEIIPFN